MLFSHCDLAVKPSHSTYTFQLGSLFLLGVVIVEELKLLTDMSQYTKDDIILILERWHLWEFAPVEPTTIVHKTISSSVLVYLLEHYVKHRKSIALLNDNHEVMKAMCIICSVWSALLLSIESICLKIKILQLCVVYQSWWVTNSNYPVLSSGLRTNNYLLEATICYTCNWRYAD